MKKILLYFSIFLAFSPTLSSQMLMGWSFYQPVTIIETSGDSLTNYPVLLTINTQTPIGLGNMLPNGEDIRFGNFCGDTLLPHWLESGINTGTTKIWVNIPDLPANDTVTLYMFYGNNSAFDATNFSLTFPLGLRTNGSNLTLAGTVNHDFIWVETNDTIFTTANSILTLNASRKIRVEANGMISGEGRGFQAVAFINAPGTGPGGGATSGNAGSGGGSYGGVGGTGGYDAGDSPGTGGSLYGTIGGPDIELGSSGGSGSTIGGHGGGCIIITAAYLTCDGLIAMDGGNAPSDVASSRGGGGGSGGGLSVTCSSVDGTGMLRAKGGNGAAGVTTANDSGGGGGGGRVKVSYSVSGSILLSAGYGLGGPFGTVAPGQNGGLGSTLLFTSPFETQPAVSFGADTTFQAAVITPNPLIACEGDTITLDVGNTGGTYIWNTSDTTQTIIVTNSGIYTVTVSYPSGCVGSSTINLNLLTGPAVNINATALDFCIGDSSILDIGQSYPTILWNTNDTTQTLTVDSSGTYIVTVTDSTGCSSTDSEIITEHPYPTPSINLLGPPCEGDTIALDAGAGYNVYSWSTADSSQTIDITASGTYYVTVESPGGCAGTDSILVSFNTPPNPVITQTGFVLDAGPGYSSYQWLLNGSNINGATNQTYTIPVSGSYSVIVTDSNGCSAASNIIIGIEEKIIGMHFSVYPNPATSVINISFEMEEPSSLRLSIFDILGREHSQFMIDAEPGTNKKAVSLNGLSPGIYFLEILYGNEKMSLRFVKE